MSTDPTAAPENIRREHGYHRLRVKKVIRETADARSFTLDIPDELLDVFGYRAGQFCTFRVRVDGAEALRSYSMSSAPETDADLTVTVKRVPDGLVSNWFNDQVDEGDVLELTRPAGVFCVREGEQPVLAFCGGSGITPVLSVAKSVLTTTNRPVHLLYANRDRESVIFADELSRLAQRYPDRLTVRHHYDSDGGFLDVRAITDFTGEDTEADCYICGPAPFMDLVEGTLIGLGVAEDSILIERFLEAGDRPVVEESTSDGEPVPTAVEIILNGKKSTVQYAAGDTLLETARRGGLAPPFSCEAGNCATCMAIMRAGSARMRENNALTEDEVAEGWVLTCQSIPQGEGTVTVEYESF